jgi:cysteine/serine-rich nuclear protein
VSSTSENEEPTKTKETPKKRKKQVSFSEVEMYLFERTQGFQSVPSDDDKKPISLGMTFKHTEKIVYQSLDHFSKYKRNEHLNKLEDFKANNENDKQDPEECDEFSSKVMFVLNDKSAYENHEVEFPANMDLIFCPILSPDKRRSKLIENEQEIDEEESGEILDIRKSRLVCGCQCKDSICNKETCSCYANGIQCQLDRSKYPCSCLIKKCNNPNGLKKFDLHSVIKRSKQVLSEQENEAKKIQNDAPLEEIATKPKRKRKRKNNYPFFSPKRKKKTFSFNLKEDSPAKMKLDMST